MKHKKFKGVILILFVLSILMLMITSKNYTGICAEEIADRFCENKRGPIHLYYENDIYFYCINENRTMSQKYYISDSEIKECIGRKK